jgi:hypothetical protein
MSPEKKDIGDFTSSILIIDACRPFHRIKEFPPVNKLSKGMRQKVWDKWGKVLDTIIKEQKGPNDRPL